MAIHYHVYTNDGAGGPVDYSAPIASTSALSFETGTLPAPSDYRFAVRAYDTESGYEEANTDAIARIVLDGLGRDVGSRPVAPHALTAKATVAGGFRAAWAHRTPAGRVEPTRFLVSIAPASAPTMSTRIGSVEFRKGQAGYSFQGSGLLDQTQYVLSVSAQGAADYLESDSVTTLFVADATAPEDVDNLIAVLQY